MEANGRRAHSLVDEKEWASSYHDFILRYLWKQQEGLPILWIIRRKGLILPWLHSLDIYFPRHLWKQRERGPLFG